MEAGQVHRVITVPTAEIPADMTAEELEILRSTATFAEQAAGAPAAALP